MNPLLLTDGYKTSHHKMYPEGTSLVYSNFTPRNVKYMPEGAKQIVVFGIQYTIKYIHEIYQNNFFSQPKEIVCREAKEYLSAYLGCDYDVSHFERLHDLGYLPIHLKGLDEGMIISERIPILTIYNTLPDFFWLPNFLETLISSLLWKPLHSASLAYGYKKVLLAAAKETDENNLGFVDFQGHDFSFRGMQHPEAAISSDLGFLTSFSGTDTIAALQAAKKFYDSINVGYSVNASEHSVVTAYGPEGEKDYFERMLNIYPIGILSLVSDSFDLWAVCTRYLPALKEQILARDGKLVIRPDSGDPVDIICGTGFSMSEKTEFYKYKNIKIFPGEEKVAISEAEHKGVIELLWDVFGGTTNSQGYKVLDPHIGCIYGDSITLERAKQITERLKAKGFASTNVVLGVGSYSMGYATRDNQGGAVKATYCEIIEDFLPTSESVEHGQRTICREIFKDPITDDGTKKSAKGLLCVQANSYNGEMQLIDQVSWEVEATGKLKSVYKDGIFLKQTTIQEIRTRISSVKV